MGIRRWYIVGEDDWYMVGANPWYIVGEDRWYMVAANSWYMIAEEYWYIVARGRTSHRADLDSPPGRRILRCRG